MFDSVADLGFALLPYCASDSSTFWNYAVTNEVISPAQLTSIEQHMRQNQRQAALYFENTDELSSLAVILKQHRYLQKSEDTWMVYPGAVIDDSSLGVVKKVETPEDLEVYLHTFNESYQKNDPTNPYGELGEYLDATRQAWMTHHQTDRIEYYIVYKDLLPVAVSALSSLDGLGYISNVGSLLSVRGQGFGKIATYYAISQSQKKKNSTHLLLTEDGTNPHRFYTALGFETKCTTRLMVKD